MFARRCAPSPSVFRQRDFLLCRGRGGEREWKKSHMGIPYREKGVSVLCVVLDAPVSVVNALTGRIGQLGGVTAKTLFSKF